MIQLWQYLVLCSPVLKSNSNYTSRTFSIFRLKFAGGCQQIQTVNKETANRVQALTHQAKQPISWK